MNSNSYRIEHSKFKNLVKFKRVFFKIGGSEHTILNGVLKTQVGY